MTSRHAGTYRYRRDGQPQPVEEPWTWTRDCLQGQRLVEGQTVLDLTARFDGAHCRSFDMHWSSGDRSRHGRYALAGTQLQWTLDGVAAQMTVPAEALLFPLLRAATGALIRQLDRGPRPVIVPDIRPDSRQPLAPLLSDREASLMAPDDAGLQCWRYSGGEYGATGCDCWLDAAGLLQRYRWASPQGVWDVRLSPP